MSSIHSVQHVLASEDNLTQVFDESFTAALANTSWQAFMGERPGLGIKENLEWLKQTLTIAKLPNGQMVFADLKSIGYQIVHEEFGMGFRVDKRQFQFDDFSKAEQAASQLGKLAAYHPQVMAEDLLKEGESQICYDQQFYFDTDHPVNGENADDGVFSNYNASNMALTPANFDTRIAAMESRVMPNGISRNVKAKYLVVPPALRKEAFEITKAKFLGQSTGGTNDNVLTLYGVEPIVIPGLAASAGGSDTTWYLFGEEPGIMGKPLVYSIGDNFGLNSYDGVTQAELMRLNALEYMLRGFIAAAYGHPYLADKNVG